MLRPGIGRALAALLGCVAVLRGAAADVFRVLTLGVGGTPMASFAGALSEEQRWELAAFVLTLRPPAASQR